MKKLTIILLFLGGSYFGVGQDIDFGTFLEGGVEDANTLLQKYMEPTFEGFGYAMNSGWYNTAKPHKLLGFDLTINTSLAYIPDEARFYTLDDADYQNVKILDPLNPDLAGERKAPVFMGPNLNADDIPRMLFNEGQESEIRLSAPTGIGMNEVLGFRAVPSPSVQLAIGLIKNTGIKLRIVPEVSVDGFTTSTFGIGVLHDVKQWIPGMKNLPFDMSAFIGYTKMKNSYTNSDESQTVKFDVGGTTFQLAASKKISVLTVYTGVGYLSSNVDFGLLGTYDTEATTLVDPVNFTYNSGGMRAKFGARLKLLVFTFHAEYAFQKYNVFNAGFGISVR